MEKQLSSIETDASITRLKVSEAGEKGILMSLVDWNRWAIDPGSPNAAKPKYVYEILENGGNHWYVSINGNTHKFIQAHAEKWVPGSLHRIYAKTMEGYDYPFFAVDFCEVVPGQPAKAAHAQPAETTTTAPSAKQKRGDNVAWAITSAIAAYPFWIAIPNQTIDPNRPYLEQIDQLAEEFERMHERRMLFPKQ